MMARYEVYLYNVPKVTEDGKQPIPVPGNQSKEFERVDEAKQFAAGNKDKFDRVVLMETNEDGQKLLERYQDGKYERAEDILRR